MEKYEKIPVNVYWSEMNGNFYGAMKIGCGQEFYDKWSHRKDEFPKSFAELPVNRRP